MVSRRGSGHAQYPHTAKKNMSPPAQTAWLHVWVRSRNHASSERRKIHHPNSERHELQIQTNHVLKVGVQPLWGRESGDAQEDR